MIDGLKPYPEYKETGVSWLGSIPAHWEVRRLRNGTEMRVSNVDKHMRDGEQPVRLCNYVDVYKHNRIRLRMPFMCATASSDEIARFHLQSGDVLITKDSEAWNDIGVPALVEETANDLICGYHLALLRPQRDRLHGEYLFRALQSTRVAYQFHVEANGVTRYGLSHIAIKSIWLPFPPLPEQDAIARFLDYINRKIERYILAKKKLIGLLNEQKQAIIHRAVTRGLDPDVRLKPSGIPWLGEIPEHWEVVILRMRYSVELGKMLDAKRISGRYSVPYLRNRDVQWDRVNVENLPTMDIAPEEYDRYTVRPGDMLVCEGGQVGRSAFWRGQLPVCGFQKALHRVRPINSFRDDPRFMFYLNYHAAGRGVFAADGNENTIAHLTCEKLRRYRFAFPSLKEQETIVRFLDESLQAFNITITRTEREIALICEYRTRLVADVVTGQVDVREEAAKLPDESREEDVELVEKENGEEGEPSEFDDIGDSGTISQE